jgi:hypothetical protein
MVVAMNFLRFQNPMMLRDRIALDNAKAKLWEPLMDWIHRPSVGKAHLITTYQNLSAHEKSLLDDDVLRVFRHEYGTDTAIVYRYRIYNDHCMGGMSVSDFEPKYLVDTTYKKFRIHASDVLAHYGQEDLPLGTKSFKHEKEIVLKPDARPEAL